MYLKQIRRNKQRSNFSCYKKQDDIISDESDCSSLISNRHQDELASNISTLETSATTVTTDDRKFYIKEHESPSTSAAAIAAAEAVTVSNSKNSDTFAPSLLQQKSIFRKSSAFFNQKILGKKSSAATMQDCKLEFRESIKKKRSSGFIIKEQHLRQQPQQQTALKPKWWKPFKPSSFT